jgi:serine/threonine protein kinase
MSNNKFIVKTGEDKEIAKGAQGRLKLAQKRDTSELCLVKITKITNPAKQEYKKKEARNEAEFLQRKGLLLGYQERSNDKKEDKIYSFIKILPGVMFCNPDFPPDKTSETLVKYAVNFTEIDQCILLLNILTTLDALKKEGLIHRDLHGGNILVDPVTMETNIIDFGLSLDADANGFCAAKSVGDKKGQGPDYRFANGYDIVVFSNYLYMIIADRRLREIYNELEKASVSSTENHFNSINLDTAIEKVRAYLEILQESKRLSSRRTAASFCL